MDDYCKSVPGLQEFCLNIPTYNTNVAIKRHVNVMIVVYCQKSFHIIDE